MSSPSAPTRHWVIGDVHGCAQALEQLVEALPDRDRLVLCGDVINRGPQIERSMELAWDLVQRGRAVWLQGNHEAALVAALRRGDWQAEQTLAGCDTYRQLGDRRCRLWLDRLASLPLTYEGDGWVATHAGFDPLTWEPCLTVRMPFWEAYDGRFGDVIVAHTPGHGVRRQGRGRIVLVDTGACYGGLLSAYCPETGCSLSVPGRRPWFLRAGLTTGPMDTLRPVCRS
jgi:serine/threonine protein phosphatase 1